MSKLFFFIYTLIGFSNLFAQTSVLHLPGKDTTAINRDSVVAIIFTEAGRMPNILDSISDTGQMRKVFFLNENINGYRVSMEEEKRTRDLPRLKAIKDRPVKTQSWKFWVMMLVIFYIGIVRLVNVKRFDEVLLAAFDQHTILRNFTEKGSNYLLTAVALFVAFIVSFALFTVSYLEKTKRFETDNFFMLFVYFLLALIAIYFIKVLLNLVISAIFKMKGMAILVLLNTVFINNFLGILLIFLTLIYIYVPGSKALATITGISFVTIIVAVIYRIIKNLSMFPRVTQYPIIYIFLYLCAFEIFPWLVVFKLFLNGW
ncbi:MAG: DUF4271 domain-containing protein [Bacteroidia bacterium]|nr:DUF4271 domain-containing protein [Bacteroidia bacterium]